MTTETEKPANALKPDPKYVHGVDHGIAPDVAVADDGGVHHATTREQDANPLSNATTKTKSQQRPKRHHVVQTGVIRNASVEEVRSVFLDVNNMWKWHWQMERVEVVHEGDPRSGDDDDEDGPVTPMNYEQRVYWYQDTKRESQQADSPRRGGGVSTRPTVQKVVAVRPNAVTLHVERRPPVRRVQVVLSVEAQEDGGTKVIVDFSYELGWFHQVLVSLGVVNPNRRVRAYIKKDIAALRHYMETREIITPETPLDLSQDD